MATSVILPKQGQSVETCIITEWYKQKGDRVEKGDLLFAYETDKASFEEESPADGILLEIYYEAGDEVPVLSEMALIGEKGEEPGKPEAAGEKTETAEPGETDSGDKPEEPSTESGEGKENTDYPITEGKIRISPRARKLADEKGIPIEGMEGSGPNGRIIVRDIEKASMKTPSGRAVTEVTSTGAKEQPVTEAQAPAPPETATAEAATSETAAPDTAAPQEEAVPPREEASAAGEREWEDRPLSNIRKLIGRGMHASLQNSAQLTHHLSADARSILSLRSKVKKMRDEGYEHNVTLNDMICYSVIRALKKHPGANAHFLGESIRYFSKVHLGMAVDTERGLMVPALKNADDLSLSGLSGQLQKLAEAARSGKIDPDLLQPDAATFTVSNLGNYGVEMFTPVINLPQAGILGVNTIIQRPAQLEGGAFGFVPYLGLSLTYDHRAMDGGPATLFLAEIKKEIESFNHDLIKQ